VPIPSNIIPVTQHVTYFEVHICIPLSKEVYIQTTPNSEPPVADQYKEENYPEVAHMNAVQQHNKRK
jgi:hypothetical protein